MGLDAGGGRGSPAVRERWLRAPRNCQTATTAPSAPAAVAAAAAQRCGPGTALNGKRRGRRLAALGGAWRPCAAAASAAASRKCRHLCGPLAPAAVPPPLAPRLAPRQRAKHTGANSGRVAFRGAAARQWFTHGGMRGAARTLTHEHTAAGHTRGAACTRAADEVAEATRGLDVGRRRGSAAAHRQCRRAPRNCRAASAAPSAPTTRSRGAARKCCWPQRRSVGLFGERRGRHSAAVSDRAIRCGRPQVPMLA